jgi:hypothetical protein
MKSVDWLDIFSGYSTTERAGCIGTWLITYLTCPDDEAEYWAEVKDALLFFKTNSDVVYYGTRKPIDVESIMAGANSSERLYRLADALNACIWWAATVRGQDFWSAAYSRLCTRSALAAVETDKEESQTLLRPESKPQHSGVWWDNKLPSRID